MTGSLDSSPAGAAGDRPTVSVVMIVFNAGDYLQEAVDSVLAQSAADLELLIVDDGSTDGSLATARRSADGDPRVRVLQHPGSVNRGTGASRALGVQQATGRWITFLDADDVWAVDHLQGQLAAAAAEPLADLVISPAVIWVSWRGEGEDHVRELGYPAGQLLATGALLDSVTFTGAPVPTCGLMFRRELVPAGGLGDPEFRGLFEDQAIIARLAVDARAVLTPVASSFYRQHQASTVHRSPGRGSRDPATLRYLAWIEAFLREHAQLTPAREARLAEVRSGFEPRWRFWLWYGTRWTAMRVLPEPVQQRLRRGRAGATGVLSDGAAGSR